MTDGTEQSGFSLPEPEPVTGFHPTGHMSEEERALREGQPYSNPFEQLAEGMHPLPPDTDMKRLSAAYDLIGRCGGQEFEVGYDDEWDPERQWYAQVLMGDLMAKVERCTDPAVAAERLARKLVNGGTCTHCGRVCSLRRPGATHVAPADGGGTVCFWFRDGARWERGCIDTHAEREGEEAAKAELLRRTTAVRGA